MNNILITGANGQLGSEIKYISKNYPDYNFLFANSDELDIRDFKKIRDFVNVNSVNAIINCAAYTKVDKAEDEFEIANQTNHLAVANFAKIAFDRKIKLIHISTDYVFDGKNNNPYHENDYTNPSSVYGKTKLKGELAIRKINPQNSAIIRTSWVYSKFGSNFVKTMLRLSDQLDEINVVSDQFGSPTNAADLATAIMEILPKLKNNSVEIYNYSNKGVCSWADFCIEIFRFSDINCKVNKINSSEFYTKAERPMYSVLETSKIESDFGIIIPTWQKSLGNMLNEKFEIDKK